ncbi:MULTISPECIES: cytochrome C [unclassified Duganella]|uniref:cytochrome C n=1 Tax=unclassified Duganella TaxID=2636909 RepID=UPI001E56E754|nr:MULTISPECIES: cytochrome C [unclassified Duganella]
MNIASFATIRYARSHCLAWLLLAQLLGSPILAHALPAFARQTGQNCVACHAGGQFPELTSYGRLFKMTGYTIGNKAIPLSAMGIASYTKSSSPADDPTFAKDAVALFQTGSVFVAGKLNENVGVFAQATYNNYDSQNPDSGGWQGKWASDNFELRYADRMIDTDRDLIFGLTLNNNPSLADPWNTAPAWMQYVPTQFGVTGPDAAPIVSQLGTQAAGVAAYAFLNQTLYAEVATYQTANGAWSFLSQGTKNADQVELQGSNPYARLALSHDWGPHSAMIGVMAMNANIYPDNLNPSGPTIHYHDRGIDAQYQYLLDPHAATVQLSYIAESIDNGGVAGIAANSSNRLKQLRIKGSYVYRARYGGSLSYFSTTGSSDTALYPDAASNPDTRGWVPEVFWTPVQYLRVGAQYFNFKRYHGAVANYDGAGRNPDGNNTVFVYVWGAY